MMQHNANGVMLSIVNKDIFPVPNYYIISVMSKTIFNKAVVITSWLLILVKVW